MSADDLNLLDPPVQQVTFRGERLDIRPLVLGQIPRFSRLVRPVVAEFFGGRHPAWMSNDEIMCDELFELHGEAIVEAVAIAARRPVEFIAECDNASELLVLARAVIEVNRDFFSRAVRAVVVGLRQAPPIGGDGPMASSDLSAPVTH